MKTAGRLLEISSPSRPRGPAIRGTHPYRLQALRNVEEATDWTHARSKRDTSTESDVTYKTAFVQFEAGMNRCRCAEFLSALHIQTIESLVPMQSTYKNRHPDSLAAGEEMESTKELTERSSFLNYGVF